LLGIGDFVELLRLEMRGDGLKDRLQLALHDKVKLM